MVEPLLRGKEKKERGFLPFSMRYDHECSTLNFVGNPSTIRTHYDRNERVNAEQFLSQLCTLIDRFTPELQ